MYNVEAGSGQFEASKLHKVQHREGSGHCLCVSVPRKFAAHYPGKRARPKETTKSYIFTFVGRVTGIFTVKHGAEQGFDELSGVCAAISVDSSHFRRNLRN
ncbi:hypothetical protein [Paenibacillus violae]|uniref:hypothetical protein n=1 Tax=Paenibacillus TaxID=44249 RepID=UPI0028FC1322|nr:hypothetical protein [Paenibacillus sp. PFR10]